MKCDFERLDENTAKCKICGFVAYTKNHKINRKCGDHRYKDRPANLPIISFEKARIRQEICFSCEYFILERGNEGCEFFIDEQRRQLTEKAWKSGYCPLGYW